MKPISRLSQPAFSFEITHDRLTPILGNSLSPGRSYIALGLLGPANRSPSGSPSLATILSALTALPPPPVPAARAPCPCPPFAQVGRKPSAGIPRCASGRKYTSRGADLSAKVVLSMEGRLPLVLLLDVSELLLLSGVEVCVARSKRAGRSMLLGAALSSGATSILPRRWWVRDASPW
jgi:hypothetical protein